MTILRVATYNLHDLVDDRSALDEVLRGLDADVVCVQEVPRTPAGDLAARRLGAATGYDAGRTHAFGGGTTVFTGPRVDVVRRRHVPLAVPLAQRRRGYAVLDGRVEGAAFRAISVHLGLQAVQRRRHATRVLGDAVLQWSGPVVVAGDANETADGDAVGILRRELAPLGRTVATYPSDAPRHPIDVVLGRGWLSAREATLDLDGRVMRAASDHLPRMVELEL